MRKKFLLVLLVFWFASAGGARAQTSLDHEMSGLAAKISKSLVTQGYKNVAALDFTDLQGQPIELGRFLSEELAVEIVSTGGVSMVDRANIKSILAEHKLTEAGLVDPANAKKLGEFAGVDAILIGNVTMLDDGIILMVKAIATSSAKIVAAGRIKFPKTSEIQQLLNRGISSNGTLSTTSTAGSGPSYQDANAIATKDIGSLRVVLKSVLPMKVKDQSGLSVNGIRCTLEFINLETQRPIVVAMNAVERSRDGLIVIGKYLRSSLVDENGAEWRLRNADVAGISIVGAGQKNIHQDYDPSEIGIALSKRNDLNSDEDTQFKGTSSESRYTFIFGSTTEMSPGQRLTVTMSFFQDVGQATHVVPTVFQITSEIVVGISRTGTKNSYTLHNLSFDRVSISSKK